MTNYNDTTWHLSQMPNLIETLRVLDNSGVEVIGINTQTNPLCLNIHCYNDTEHKFTEWVRNQEGWEVRELKDSIYPAEVYVYLNGCKVFSLIHAKEWEEEWGEDNA